MRIDVSLLLVEGHCSWNCVQNHTRPAVEFRHALYELQHVLAHSLSTRGLVCTENIQFQVVLTFKVNDCKALGLVDGKVSEGVFGPQNIHLVLLAEEEHERIGVGNASQVVLFNGSLSAHIAYFH